MWKIHSSQTALVYECHGTIYINDKAVKEFSCQFGFVAQIFSIYQGTIMENLRMGKEVEKSKVIELNCWMFIVM